MNKTQAASSGLLVVLALAFAVYLWRGTPPKPRPVHVERRAEVADLRKQIGILEERVNSLEERLAAQRVARLHHKEQ